MNPLGILTIPRNVWPKGSEDNRPNKSLMSELKRLKRTSWLLGGRDGSGCS